MAEDTPEPGSARPRPARPARQPSGADMGWSVTGMLLSGMAVWGGVGWLIDRWLNITVFFPFGIILGVAVAIYVVVKTFDEPDQAVERNPGGRRSRPRTQKGQR